MTSLQKAKYKALVLLQYSDRTESEMRERLQKEGYDGETVGLTLKYLKEAGYINDIRYSESLVRRTGSSKSRFQIKTNLIKKGVSAEDIEKAFELIDEEQEFLEKDFEEEAVRKLLLKGIRRKEVITPDEKRKIFASVYRKGFPFQKIKKVWDSIQQEEGILSENETFDESSYEDTYDNIF